MASAKGAIDLYNKINGTMSKVAGTDGSELNAESIMKTADALSSMSARLDMINGKLQTNQQVQDKIFASAQRTSTPYLEVADNVAKIGASSKNAFSNTDEVIMFVEQMNKQFAIGNVSIDQQKLTMMNLASAMAAGKLNTLQFTSILGNAPMLAQAIADKMHLSVGEVTKLAGEGKISSGVLKQALFASIDDVNGKADMMPTTFANVWIKFSNSAQKAFQPIFKFISKLAQSKEFQSFLTGVIGVVVIISNVLQKVFDLASNIYNFFKDNWPMIGPVIWGLALALIVYKTQLLLTAIATSIATFAQLALDVAMGICPLTWIILIIIALIVIVYLVIAAINKFAGTSISATGVILGAFCWLGAAIWNIIIGVINAVIQAFWFFADIAIDIIEWLLNVSYGGFGSFGDAIKNLLGDICGWFLSFGEIFTKLIDAVCGTKLTNGLESLKGKVLSWGNTKTELAVTLDRGKNARSIESLTGGKVGRVDYNDAYNMGYKTGETAENMDPGKWLKDLSDTIGGISGNNSFDDLKKGLGAGNPGGDPNNGLDKLTQNSALQDIQAGVGDTANNTDKMSKTMDATGDELKYLRDLAEQDVINRFTTAKIDVNLGGVTNNVNSEMDLDGVVGYLENKLYESMQVAAEGVHK
jgi:tape measure domain-containing protein